MIVLWMWTKTKDPDMGKTLHFLFLLHTLFCQSLLHSPSSRHIIPPSAAPTGLDGPFTIPLKVHVSLLDILVYVNIFDMFSCFRFLLKFLFLRELFPGHGTCALLSLSASITSIKNYL
jgi:hypothetical protein